MIKTITMRHSTKRSILRLSISPTSPHREVANRHSFNSAPFAGLLRWPLTRLTVFYTMRHNLSNSVCPFGRAVFFVRKIFPAVFPF